MTAIEKKNPWPLGGYAPGFYSYKCCKCSQIFMGDKRASECLECAVYSMKEAFARARKQHPNDAAAKALRTSIDTLTHALSGLGGGE